MKLKGWRKRKKAKKKLRQRMKFVAEVTGVIEGNTDEIVHVFADGRVLRMRKVKYERQEQNQG